MQEVEVGAAEELVRLSVEAFNARDVAALLDTFADDVELVPFSAKLDGSVYRGAEGVRRWLVDLEDEWSEWRVELESFETFGDRILSTGRVLARARSTGIEAEVPASWVLTVREGAIVRMESYGDVAEARAAVNN
jgi:ketosteroid isomerase-like protein